MPNIQSVALNLAVAGLAGEVTHLSLHSTNGSTDGSGEFTGGSYSRQAVTYENTGAGTQDITATAEFGGPASQTTANYVGFWDDTTWLMAAPLPTPKTVDPEDELHITSAEISVAAAT